MSRQSLPRKSDSNIILAASVLVREREQQQLLPETRMRIPEYDLSILSMPLIGLKHFGSATVLAPSNPDIRFELSCFNFGLSFDCTFARI